jgi:cell division protein YceG involved in septum cleavage
MYIKLSKYNTLIFAVIVLLFIIFITTFAFGNTGAKEPKSTYYKVVQIKKGDTLWSIAKTHSNSHSDIRNFIVEIKTFNHMTSEVLIAGQNIILPMHDGNN